MKLSYIIFLEDAWIYLDMRDNAFSCRAAFLHNTLICSEKLSFSSIMTPSTLTQASDDKTVSFPRVIHYSFRGTRESNMNWNFSGLACIPFTSNHCTALLPSYVRLARTISRLEAALDIVLTMAMKITLLPCNTCSILSNDITLTGYIQQSINCTWKTNTWQRGQEAGAYVSQYHLKIFI